MIRRVWPAFVIEIVQEADAAPLRLVLAQFTGVGPHGGFDGQHVPDEVFVLGVFADECQIGLTTHSRSLPGDFQNVRSILIADPFSVTPVATVPCRWSRVSSKRSPK